MKKRIGTLKGKPIVEGGGGSNIIKENEISINDIGSSSNEGDDGILYFGCSDNEMSEIFMLTNSYRKLVEYGAINKVSINMVDGIPDHTAYFYEFGINPNSKTMFIYSKNKWMSPKELLEIYGVKLEYFKPISKYEFYRTEYTVEEAKKIKEEYYNHYLQNAPSEP